MRLMARFRSYPYCAQVLVVLWSSCGIGPRGTYPQAVLWMLGVLRGRGLYTYPLVCSR